MDTARATPRPLLLLVVRSIGRRPLVWGAATWLMSAAAGTAAVLLANFGAPAWTFLALGAWLWTVGLPTLVAALLVFTVWAGLPPNLMPSAAVGGGFLVMATLVAQAGCAVLLARRLRRRGEA